MPQYDEETLKKMVVKSLDPALVTLTTICEKFNIQKGEIYLVNLN